MEHLEAELIMQLFVDCEDGLKIPDCNQGFFQAIPITGGYFTGKISGKIISGGYDFNNVNNGYVNRAFAKYIIQTDDGDYISVENEGYMDVQHFMDSHIKTTPRFICSEKYRFLQTGVFVGSLAPRTDGKPGVMISFYKMK